MLSDDFFEYITTSVSIYPFASKDKFGQNTYGSAVTVNAILSESIITKADKDNTTSISESKLFVDGDVVIGQYDKIVFNSLNPEIRKINSIRDDEGIYCKIIYI